MEPWEIAERLTAATDQEIILKEIAPIHPFWIGATYAVDPFVGRIFKLPLTDPPRYERGLSAELFDRVVQAILTGELRGDRLAGAIEAMSRACTYEQWNKWYRPILEGNCDLRVPLDLFNKYAPIQVGLPALSRPKALTPASLEKTSLPAEFFLQPAYENRCFWLLDSRTALIEVRGYADTGLRLRDPQIEKSLIELGKQKPVDVVILGYFGDGLVVDDLVTREHFTREYVPFPLRQRLEAARTLGLPLVQRSDVLTEFGEPFLKELGLIFDQRFRGALLRDLAATYPFQVQCDWKLTTKSWLKQVPT